MAWAASAMISTVRQAFMPSSPASAKRMAAVAMPVRGQSALKAMPSALNSSAMPSTHIDMPNLAIE